MNIIVEFDSNTAQFTDLLINYNIIFANIRGLFNYKKALLPKFGERFNFVMKRTLSLANGSFLEGRFNKIYG